MTSKTVRLPVGIPVFPYLLDHRFEGSAVFPAVEAMQVLAQSVKEFAPQTDITAITDTTFDKFLFIPPDKKKLMPCAALSPLKTVILPPYYRQKPGRRMLPSPVSKSM